MLPVQDHPLRYQLANELHARPFPSMPAPCMAAYIAFKKPSMAASRDRQDDRSHLLEFLDRHGAPHPQPGATHYYGKIGRHWIKWEQHAEFVTYTLLSDGVSETPFDGQSFSPFPKDWLKSAPGERVTSIEFRIEEGVSEERIRTSLAEWFVPESLAVSSVLDDAAVLAGDFRIDSNGHLRFAVFVSPETGPRRVGRIIQRLCEIETYKSMSMLGFSRVRDIGKELNALDRKLTDLISSMSDDSAAAEDGLSDLLRISADLERLEARSSFRFGATFAYQAIVGERIEALREEGWQGRQSFREFMVRRYEPAMRTVRSTETRLQGMSNRSIRASTLLRTRVDVERSAQNQKLLESMDRRSDLQLRLQRTVEGLSVVAISYYAVSLAVYFFSPLAELAGIGKSTLTAAMVPVIVLFVWLALHRIKRGIE